MTLHKKEQKDNTINQLSINDNNYENKSSTITDDKKKLLIEGDESKSYEISDNKIEITNNNQENTNSVLYEFNRNKAYNKVSKAALLFLLYNLIFGLIFRFITNPGLYNIVIITFSLILLYFYIGKDKKVQILSKHKKMSFKDLLFFIGLMYALNYIFSYLTIFLVEIIGLPSINVTDLIAKSATPILLVYAILVGPLFEEIQYRGFYQNHVRKYGIQAAILISTITFSFAHLNIIQSIGTLGIGLMISYISYVYSFKMGLLVHIINNAIAFLLSYQFDKDENSIIITITGAILIILILYSLFRLIFRKKYKELYEEFKYKNNEKENFQALFKNSWFIAYIIISLLLSIVSGFIQ